MHYLALATDYDGTLARDGKVDAPTLAALERFRAADGKLVLVTGRELEELIGIFPQLDRFHIVVAENGGILYRPETGEETRMGPAPPAAFIEALRARGVGPISVGRVVVATWEPHSRTVAEVIRSLGLNLRMILNKRAVMILPGGITKGSGLRAALEELGIAPEQVAAIGDAENDLDMLEACGLAAAVANALPTVKARARVVMRNESGAGVAEVIELLLADMAVNHSEAIE